jgi:two-component system chemotaxis response regulator CheB
MSVRVLIVDDSSFICKRIQQILQEEPDFMIVGIARNGLEAVDMNARLKPDVVTMDVEMPIMDGITAVKKIMLACPVPILMFSSSTHFGASATLDALEAGAMDFLPKQLDEIDGNHEMAKRMLRRRVRIVAMQTAKAKMVTTHCSPSLAVAKSNNLANRYDGFKSNLRLLVIVASTGGPVAIQKMLPSISSACHVPILIVQHMPNNFTHSFAERLNQLTRIKVREAVHGDLLEPGLALLAPGGQQMEVTTRTGSKRILLTEKKAGQIYSPCADITLSSVAQHYKDRVLTVVLTGMGADGKAGAEKLKQAGSIVWAQDEASCTIYGMPKAVVDANLADQVYSLNDIATEFEKIF